MRHEAFGRTDLQVRRPGETIRGAPGRAVRPLLAACFMLMAATAAAITLVSVRDEIEIGRHAQAQLREQVPELPAEWVRTYVRGVGRRLAARAQGPRYPYSFSTADYREINAFALPGGPVWVHRGAMEAARNESQLAAVLAHEVAHIARRHAADQLTRVVIANWGLGLLGSLLGNSGGATAAQVAARLITTGTFLKFGRDDEREADRVGAQIMHRAGWNARGMIGFLLVLREESGRDPGSVEVFLSSHPSPKGRIEELNRDLAGLGGGRTDSDEFHEMKRRLTRLPPARRMPRG